MIVILAAMSIGVIAQTIPVQAEPVGWIGNSEIKVVSDTLDTSIVLDDTPCPGRLGSIELKTSDYPVEACIFGESSGARLARVRSPAGQFLYAFSYSSEDTFSIVQDFCVGYTLCGYSQSEDAVLKQEPINGIYALDHAVEGEFSTRLSKLPGDNRYLRYTPGSSVAYVQDTSRRLASNGLAISENGAWALVELKTYGFIRVNMHTLHMQRVVAPGVTYGQGVAPRFDMTITNDGRYIAIAGFRAGLDIYEITDNCGEDIRTIEIGEYFSVYAFACKARSVEYDTLLPHFTYAREVEFITGNTQLSFYISAENGVHRVLLSPFNGVTTVAGAGRYLVFGDSFTSGEGETDDAFYISSTNTASNRCHVSTRSYPQLVGVWWGMTVGNYSCSGSSLSDIARVQSEVSKSTTEGETQPIKALSFGAGGNDIDLVGKLKTCLGIGVCEWASSALRSATAQEIRALFPKLVDAIRGFQQQYPRTALLVYGYPRVVNPTAQASCEPYLSLMLSREEREYFDESIRYLNQILEAAAWYTGIRYVDIEDALEGERLCDTKSTAMNGIRFGDDIAPIAALGHIKMIGAESFHPTPRGHRRIADSIKMTLKDYWSAPACIACVFDVSQLSAPSYWQEGSFDTHEKLINRNVARAGLLEVGSQVGISLPESIFKPNSQVTIEVHSDPHIIGTYSVNDKGGLDQTVTVPMIEHGFHTLHIKGMVVGSEVAVDVYQTVYIGDVNDLPRTLSNTLPSSPPLQQGTPRVDLIGSTPSGRMSLNASPLPLFTLPSGEVLGLPAPVMHGESTYNKQAYIGNGKSGREVLSELELPLLSVVLISAAGLLLAGYCTALAVKKRNRGKESPEQV